MSSTPPASLAPPLAAIESLTVEFRVASRALRSGSTKLRALDDVSLDLARGETLALVGESGCGKTTVGRTLIRLYRPAQGRIRFDGADVTNASGSTLRDFRRRAQMVFQDPYASLNPRMKVEDIIAEPLRAYGIGGRSERRERVRELLDLVGLAADSGRRFPHAFSGGQRQRIGIARALALRPDLLIADEPVSALDVSIQAQIVNLMKDLQAELGLTTLFIAHDLAVVRNIAQRVAVMYLGKVVELAPRDALFDDPLHPYTRSLLSAVPIPDPDVERTRERIVLSGEVPSPINPPSGCRFHTRCPSAMPVCATTEPRMAPVRGTSRLVACHLVHPPTPDHSPSTQDRTHVRTAERRAAPS
jgi:oligopeptide transport system ATP-binding protein